MSFNKQKKFNGKIYKLSNYSKTKRGSNSLKKKYKNSGYNYRIIKEKSNGHIYYLIYTTKR
jgi:hypothetical protein